MHTDAKRGRPRLFRMTRRIYPFRVIGMGLGGFAAAAVLYQIKAPVSSWIFVAFSALVWPHLAYWIALRSVDPYRAEIRNLLIDSAIAGALVPLMHFNLLPSTLLITLTTVDKISTGIRALWLRSMPGLLLAMLIATVFTRGAFDPATNMPVLLACLPVLLIHTIAVSLGSYRLIRTVSLQNQELDRLRRVDTLTGLSRRDDWEEKAEQVLHDCGERSRAACMFLIDVDRFKQINDQHGHNAGDETLRAVADQLREILHPSDSVGRHGGDEFVVALPGTPIKDARAIAEQLRKAVEEVRLLSYPAVRATISIGIAVPPVAPATLHGWLKAADNALYHAKHQGRNRVAG